MLDNHTTNKNSPKNGATVGERDHEISVPLPAVKDAGGEQLRLLQSHPAHPLWNYLIVVIE